MTQFQNRHLWRLGPESSTTWRSPGAEDSMREVQNVSRFEIFPTKTISWHWHFLRTHSSFFLGVPGYLGLTLNETTNLFLLSRRLFFWGDKPALTHIHVTKTRNWMYPGPSIEMVVPRGCAHVRRCFSNVLLFQHAQGHKYKIWGHIHTEILLLRYI